MDTPGSARRGPPVGGPSAGDLTAVEAPRVRTASSCLSWCDEVHGVRRKKSSEKDRLAFMRIPLRADRLMRRANPLLLGNVREAHRDGAALVSEITAFRHST